MNILFYSTVSILILFLSYRISLSRTYIISLFLSVLILLIKREVTTYEKLMILVSINTLPLFIEMFKKDFQGYKEDLRAKFEDAKKIYEDIVQKDKRIVNSNLEMKKKLGSLK